MTPAPRRADRVTATLVALAAVWSVGLVVAGTTVPAYDSSTVVTSTSTPGSVPRTHRVEVAHSTTATLLQVNGPGVLVLLALPLVAVTIVAGLLVWRRARGRPGAGAPAWTVTALLGAFGLVGILTIGPFVIPVPVLLAAACGRTGSRSPSRT
ncbi:MAG: hypothetical protein ACYDHU_06310 [Acidimicrobiales bacterium]